MGLFEELRRRNVFRVGIAYIVLGWLLLQVTDVVVPILDLPVWVARLVLFLLLVGFPLVLFFAWAYELTPQGVKPQKEVDRNQSITTQTGKKLDRAIIVILFVAVALLVFDRFRAKEQDPVIPGDRQAATGEPAQVPEPLLSPAAKSVAVLPFLAMSSGPDDEYFADGLTEEILNALAQLPELLVTARTSAFHFKGRDVPVADIAAALGVGHIVEGSIRRSGDRLRITAQLIRAEDGFHLWSENYDRTEDDAIAVQEDVAEKIAQALDVVMDERGREAMRRAGLRNIEAFVDWQKGREWYARAHDDWDQIEALRNANRYFEAVLERVPEYAPAYTEHSDLYVHIALNDASGQMQPGVSEPQKEAAFGQAAADLRSAVRFAATAGERHGAELDLAFLTGNWRGITGRLERVRTGRGCATSNWHTPLAVVFGYAGQFLERQREFRACNPLNSTSWFNEARLHLWAGDARSSLETTLRGDELAPGGWLNHAMVRALVASGRFDDAERLVEERMHDPEEAMVFKTLSVAARGDREQASALVEAYLAKEPVNQFWAFLLHAWTGNREAINALAAETDLHPAGSLTLTIGATWCACGAPFDLDAAPNFKANLEEAGLPWPPASPIRFPLKDW